jgi:hypothetical protein
VNANLCAVAIAPGDLTSMPTFQDDAELDSLIARAKLRISYVAGGLNDHDGQSSLRRVDLGPRLTVYSHLYSIMEASLIDVEASEIALDQFFDAFMNTSSVVAEFNVANGTNVRLMQGESIICCGDQELVAMKLSQDELVTYRAKEQCVELLEQVVVRLDGIVHEGWCREINIMHQQRELLGEA